SAENYSAQGISIFALEGSERLEYRLTRLSLDFVPRSPEMARLFDLSKTEDAALPTAVPPMNPIKPAPDANTPAPNASPTTSAPPRPLTYFNSQASDAEAIIAQALHRVGADLGEEINVFPMSDGSVLVQGLV